MPSSKSSSKSRSATPEDQWSHDFTSSFYKGQKGKNNKFVQNKNYLLTKRHNNFGNNYNNEDPELSQKKFNHKRILYMRKYGDNFDENKLPHYLRSFDAYTKGRDDFMRNNRQNNGPQQPPYANNNNNYRQNAFQLRKNSNFQQVFCFFKRILKK